MKRCPQCSFLYLDTDEVCDLDGTPLVQASESELEGSVTPTTPIPTDKPQRPGRKRLVFTAIGGLLLGVIFFLGYFAIARRSNSRNSPQQPIAQVAIPSPAESLATPTATPAASPEPSPSPTENTAPSPNARSGISPRVIVSNNPVSTAPAASTQTQMLIRLTNGARIEADEVWRTKEGVWYRRNGVVTLLKANRVKSIEKTARK
jgi:hypothetical protein